MKLSTLEGNAPKVLTNVVVVSKLIRPKKMGTLATYDKSTTIIVCPTLALCMLKHDIAGNLNEMC